MGTPEAMVSQFVEIPEGVVFTVEYSVRTAMTAVYDFLSINKEIPNGQPGIVSYDTYWGRIKGDPAKRVEPADSEEPDAR